MPKAVLSVFDFDHTLCEDNSDIVARKLLPDSVIPPEVRILYKTKGWTAYMNKLFSLMVEHGISAEKVISAVANIPQAPGMESCLAELHRNGSEILIISDANSLFIEAWLKKRNLLDVPSQIYTNPARINDKGMIVVEPYHYQDWCDLSGKNLCKGYILETYIKQREVEGQTFDTVCYIGDGRNDLCPILKLNEDDIAFVRNDFVLSRMLQDKTNPDVKAVKAFISPWDHAVTIAMRYEDYLLK